MILDEAQLTAWGNAIGRTVRAPCVVLLRGPLGAGKSTLARAIARGAGVAGTMPSPTFNLVLTYTTAHGRPLVHADLYRLEDPSELGELGWEDLWDDGLTLVEWPERAGDWLPEHRWDVDLGIIPERPDVRDVRVRRVGAPAPLPTPDPDPTVEGR